MKRCMIAVSSLVAACTITAASAADVVVGGKNFTEQRILTHLTGQYLEGLGYEVDTSGGMSSVVLREAQESGQVDLYWEYTGTSLIIYNGVSDRLGVDETYTRVKELDEELGLTWLQPSRANNTYGLAMHADDAEARGIATISDLAAALNDGESLTLASSVDFHVRDDGLNLLQEAYDFEFDSDDVSRMATGQTYPALRDGDVDVAVVFTTDGRLASFGLQLLEDDLEHFPAYTLTPVVREETLETFPELEEQLNVISALLDDDSMARLNAQVDIDGDDVEDVARRFLEENELL